MAGPEKCANGYCEIPAGSFQMGSTNGDPDEKPVKTVGMTGFQLGQTEVSVADYQAHLTKPADSFTIIEATKNTPALPNFPENKKGGAYPVVGLTMDEKRAYCQTQGGDLPTAAQLHYASRFDDQDSTTGGKDQRVIWDNGFRSTEPVKGGYKNRLGVYNLLGNVWESARDAYEEGFYARMALQDPYNPMTNPWSPTNTNGQFQEFSGGSFSLRARSARPASRFYGNPGYRDGDDGFRCARPLPQDSKK